MKSLNDIVDEVYEVNQAKGWFDSERSFDEGMALIVTELAEALEAYREHGLDDVTRPHGTTLAEGFFEAGSGPLPKPEGVGSELADVLIRIADEAYRQRVDLRAAVALRGTWNHLGLAATFGDQIMALVRLVAAATPGQPSVGLSRVLIALEQLADHHDINLGAEYERKIAFNRTRPARHGGKRL